MAESIMQDEKGRYLVIPEASSHEAYDEMVAFAHSVEDSHLRELLFDALDGRGAFRRFKDVLANYPLERERWFKWQNEYERRMVIEWLNSAGFEPEERSP